MSVAKVTEISATSSKGFEDAVHEGIARATKTLKNITGAWVSEQKIDVENDKLVFDTNVWGVVRCTQAVLPTMRSQGSGHIVQISSIAGRFGIPGQPIYCASKWALEGMSENMAHDLAQHGIRVSIVEPGVWHS